MSTIDARNYNKRIRYVLACILAFGYVSTLGFFSVSFLLSGTGRVKTKEMVNSNLQSHFSLFAPFTSPDFEHLNCLEPLETIRMFFTSSFLPQTLPTGKHFSVLSANERTFTLSSLIATILVGGYSFHQEHCLHFSRNYTSFV